MFSKHMYYHFVCNYIFFTYLLEVLYKTDTSNIPLQASDVSNILLLEIQHILMNIKENLQK